MTTPDCGSVSGYSGLVAFFSGQSSRYIQTVELDLTAAEYASALQLCMASPVGGSFSYGFSSSVSFRLLIGGGSCETADNGEDVVLEYRAYSASFFTQLQLFPYYSQSHRQSVVING